MKQLEAKLNSMHAKSILLILTPALIFLIFAISTLSHYGIIWDEPDHFYRGQAYLNYYLTGSVNFNNLQGSKRSFYQDDKYTAEYYFNNDGGHPPLNGILAALTNYIFYQKLAIMGDVESLHLFGVISSSLLVLVVTFFAYQSYGILAAFVAAISLASYPLFWSESHFNVKDPVESAFFGITIWAFWMSLKGYRWRWFLLSIVSFAVALSTKFNILFLPLIIIPYLFVRHGARLSFKTINPLNIFVNLPKSYCLTMLLSPLLILSIFILSWPYLWQDLGGLFKVFGYYTERGLAGEKEAGIFLPGQINVYPVVWIIVTTPPWVLLLVLLGIICVIKVKRKDKPGALWLLWLLIPILRAMLPHARTYGGVRQLMEYVPAMALLAGLGATKLKETICMRRGDLSIPHRKFLVPFAILGIFIPHLLILTKIHPNENAYFNFLIGGLKGASEKGIPYWGNSFGNAYFQGIWWLNKNAPKGAKLALLQKVNTNVSPVFLRYDIQYFAGEYRSGVERDGEYIMELTHQGSMHYYPYVWEYVNKFLEPVYEIKVDGVSIAKVWKNDLEHTKPEMKYKEEEYIPEIIVDKNNLTIIASSKEEVLLSRIIISQNPPNDCGVIMGEVWTSTGGENWVKENEYLHSSQLPTKYKANGVVTFYFAGRQTKAVKLVLDRSSECALNDPVIKFLIFR